MSRLLSQCKSKDLWAHKMLMIRKCHAHAHIDQIGKLCNTISMKNGNDFLFGREKKNLSLIVSIISSMRCVFVYIYGFCFLLKKKKRENDKRYLFGQNEWENQQKLN